MITRPPKSLQLEIEAKISPDTFLAGGLRELTGGAEGTICRHTAGGQALNMCPIFDYFIVL